MSSEIETEKIFLGMLEAKYLSEGYSFKREYGFGFKSRVYGIDALATKGNNTIGFEIKASISDTDRIFYQLLTYSQYTNLFYLVLPSGVKLQNSILKKFRSCGLGLMTIDAISQEITVRIEARQADFVKKRNVLARGLELFPNDVNSMNLEEKALKAYAREKPGYVFKSFIESLLDNVLLGGFLVSGIVILSEKYFGNNYLDALAVAFILIPLLAWGYRYYLAAEKEKV